MRCACATKVKMVSASTSLCDHAFRTLTHNGQAWIQATTGQLGLMVEGLGFEKSAERRACVAGGGVAVRAGPGLRPPRLGVPAAAVPQAAAGGAPAKDGGHQKGGGPPGKVRVRELQAAGEAELLPRGGGLQRALLEHQQPAEVQGEAIFYMK